jgi:dihydropteroate synthase
VPPKHLEPDLVTLRDPKIKAFGFEYLERLAAQIKDRNYRIFSEGGVVHLISAGQHLASQDVFELFDQLLATQPKNIDASHAFYLGYEMAKAVTALTLGKDYRQDEALDWGYLTIPEQIHRSKHR